MSIFLILTFVYLGKLGLCSGCAPYAEGSNSIIESSFQILDVLAEGGFGIVLSVRQRSTNRKYAMKVPLIRTGEKDFSQELSILRCLDKSLTDPGQRRSLTLLSPEIQQPLILEEQSPLLDRCQKVSKKSTIPYAQRVSRLFRGKSMKPKSLELKRHSECIRGMVFPLYEGGDLQMLLNEIESGERQLKESSIFDLAIGIVRALQVLHSIGYVHQDLKPANILLDSSRPIPGSDIGQPVLADFGLAAKSGQFLIGAQGTNGYIAPETLSYHSANFGQDIFSLGSVLKQLMSLSDIHPQSLELLITNLPSPHPKDIIGRCWSSNISERPTLDEIMTYLEELREHYVLADTSFFF